MTINEGTFSNIIILLEAGEVSIAVVTLVQLVIIVLYGSSFLYSQLQGYSDAKFSCFSPTIEFFLEFLIVVV